MGDTWDTYVFLSPAPAAFHLSFWHGWLVAGVAWQIIMSFLAYFGVRELLPAWAFFSNNATGTLALGRDSGTSQYLLYLQSRPAHTFPCKNKPCPSPLSPQIPQRNRHVCNNMVICLPAMPVCLSLTAHTQETGLDRASLSGRRRGNMPDV